MAGARHPLLYEINTWPWLTGLRQQTGLAVDLASVPDAVWDELAGLGVDAVWLMGVWERSPAGISVAKGDPALLASFSRALPDLRDQDIVGSPYCIRRYEVDSHLGGREGLAAARAALAARGVALFLDFVPNHVAPDHPWTAEHPEFFVTGTADDLSADSKSFTEVAGRVLARGRDPFFPAWPDVVQLNAFAPALREAVIATLNDIGSQCDGVRCDMAMLMLNDVFERTWGERVGPTPDTEYWGRVIPAVNDRHPDFAFIAEAYWDREWDLQQLGFDFCYDKRLYDRLLHESPEEVRLHLCADMSYQDHLLRFLENHDEPRAAGLVPRDREEALAVATLTQSGARLVHDGQLTGRKVHLPVFLGRLPDEPVDVELETFHRSLLDALSDPTFHDGDWRLCERSGWVDNPTWTNLVAWTWQGESRWLVVVNLGDAPATGHVATGWDELRGSDWQLSDPTIGTMLTRAGDDIAGGLYVELEPWRWHLWRVSPVDDPDQDERR